MKGSRTSMTLSFILTGVLTGILFASLPVNLQGTVEELEASYGGGWAAGIIDLTTGETRIVNGSFQFEMFSPHLPVTVYGIEMSNSGVMKLDSLVARGEFFWEKLHWAQQGGLGSCLAILFNVGIQDVSSWAQNRGYSGTVIEGVQMDFPNAPVFDPNYTTAEDALSFLKVYYDNIENPYVAGIGTNPPLSDRNRETLGLDGEIHGWIDQGSNWRHLFVVVDYPDGHDYGVVLLNEDLNSLHDADRGFDAVFELLSD
ncbi:MAG: hypothetical protein GF388_03400 [Candidatus Aegiribacteria sp.]|nr:hypothetical protein [Candidatus Aegiribacteria sp.]MBD3294310.1 hypothetical protein [Candidatus Fermentibacteria bacterium]